MAKSSEYWKKRFLEIEKASNAYGQNTFRQIENTFEKAQMDIQKEIERWYGRYAKNNQITLQEARKQLTAKELKELRWDVDEYIKYGRENALDQKWMKELENASARFHISRLEALKIRTQHAAEKAFGNELDQIDGMARHVFTEDYYHSLFEMHKGFGIGWEVGQIDERKLNTLITKPWAADGKNFSDRVWGNRTALVNELHQQLTRTCILGKAPDDAINAIAKKMNTSKNNAGRLVMTEQAYFHSVAQKEAFKELDVEEFEIVATLDHSTSDICQEMDGKHFPMSQYEPGVTAPPFHVWCRSVTVPYFEDNYGGERAARDENGNTYYVPDNMKYDDWVDHFVDKTKDPANWLNPIMDTPTPVNVPDDIISIGDLKKPVRPRKSDFDDMDEFYSARERYREDKDKYDETLDELVEKALARPQRFQNKDEVLDWAKNLGIEIEDGFFDEIDIRVFDDVAPVLEEMFEEYPFLKSYTFNFDGEDITSVFRIGVDRSADALMSANGGLNFSPRLFSSYENGLREALDSMADDFFVRGDGSFATLLRHELGHNMDEYIRLTKFGDVYDDMGRIVEHGAKKRVAMDDELRKLLLLDGVSEYAPTNTLEIFAEAFAEYTSGGNSEFGKAFGEMLERWLS